jgi:hypothetical protein
MQDNSYKTSQKVIGQIIFYDRNCASAFRSIFNRYAHHNPTWAYIGSALGVAISEHPSKITLEKYNITAKLATVVQDQNGNPLHFSILGEE